MYSLDEEKEFEVLSDRLMGFFISKGVQSVDLASDLVQETIVRVLAYRANGNKIESLEAYSVGVAKKIFLEYLYGKKKAQKHDSIEMDTNQTSFKHYNTPEAQILHKELHINLKSAISHLSSSMKALIEDKFYKELSSKMIANKLGTTVKIVDMRVYRAKEQLRNKVA